MIALTAEVKGKMLALCGDRLRACGLDYQQEHQSEVALDRLKAIDRPASMPPLSILDNEFHETNAFWVFYKDREGRDVGATGVRLDDLGSTDITLHWAKLRRRFLSDGNMDATPLPISISGKAVYIGDMYLPQEYHDPHGHVRACIFTCYMLAAMTWPNFDYIYAVISQGFLDNGSASKYCATRQVMAPNIWCPKSNSGTYWVVSMDQEGLAYHSKVFIAEPERFDYYKSKR